MNDKNLPDARQTRLQELVKGFKKQSRKFKLLMPFKSEIEELLKRRASHDVIRLILAESGVLVSTDTVHRFCHKVIGQKTIRPYKARPRKLPLFKTSPAHPLPENKDKKTLPEKRERYLGPWMRRKPGPRIVDSKNL